MVDGYRPGRWKAVCDSCGLDYYNDELFEDWEGKRVCKKDLETRHPQEFVRNRIEKITPSWVRPAERLRDTADLTSNTTISDWSVYPNYIVYLSSQSAICIVDVGSSTDAALAACTRVQLIRMGSDTSVNTCRVNGIGLASYDLEPGQGVIVIPRASGVWEFFGRVG